MPFDPNEPQKHSLPELRKELMESASTAHHAVSATRMFLIEAEIARRVARGEIEEFTMSFTALAAQAERQTNKIIFLTWALLVLTAVLLVVTVVLSVIASRTDRTLEHLYRITESQHKGGEPKTGSNADHQIQIPR